MTAPKKYNIAVLDDYHNLSKAYLKDVDADITAFTQYVPPENLVEKLKPYDVILTMRERTRFTREIVTALASGRGGKLKVLMTTGMRNLGIDYDACKETGVILTGTPGKPLP